MAIAITYAGDTHPGRMRQNNEDNFYVASVTGSADLAAVQRNGYLFIVADGVGGNRGGARASEIAVGRVPAFYYAASNGDSGRALAGAIDGVGREIVAEGAANPERANMRCTVVAAVVKDGGATIAHLGDARAYLWRAGALRLLTRDHTWVQMQVEKGTLTEAEAQNHPDRNVITRSMGDPTFPEPSVTSVGLQEGDRLLLCSDGLSGVAVDAEIAAVLGRAPDPAAARKELIDLANHRGGPDNITAVVVQVGQPVLVARPRRSSAPLMLMLVVAAALLIGSFMIFRPSAGQANGAPPATEIAAADATADPGIRGEATVPIGAGGMGEATSTPAGVVVQPTGTITPTATAETAIAAATTGVPAQRTIPAASPTAVAVIAPPAAPTPLSPGVRCDSGVEIPTYNTTVGELSWSYSPTATNPSGSELRVYYRLRGASNDTRIDIGPTLNGSTWSLAVGQTFTTPGEYEWRVAGQGTASEWYCFVVTAPPQEQPAASPEPSATDTPVPLDSDGDGVPDSKDECPNEHQGPDPDHNHSGCPRR